MNTKTLFNDGWEFVKTSLDTTDWAGLQYEPVDLPHDWLIYNTLDLYESSMGWYRKTFTWTKNEQDVLLYFDGVYMDSTVYVNGTAVGEWKYGYSSFEHNITDALKDGENEIIVKIVHQSPNSRWYSGAGIYRNVYLKTRGRNYIETDGTYISIKQTDDAWRVEVDTELQVELDAMVTHTIKRQGQVIAESRNQVSAGTRTDEQVLTVKAPLLWSPDEPNLYQLETTLMSVEADPTLFESISQNIGFRTIVMDPNEGFSINGRKMKLFGVCEHHDLGSLGAAFNVTALRRRFEMLKEMGVNGIRTAHNMPAPELMDLADEMGFFVVSEAFDMWERPKTEYDYARFFKEWAAADVRSWVRRDRNHPSLIMWSIGNEIYDTHADERGQEITRMLMAFVHEHDPKHNAGVTIGSNFMPWENARKCADIVKLAGYNYAERYYHEHHEQYPDWIIYGSETASVVQSRGIYHFPYERSILTDDNEQCSSLGNSRTSWGSKSPEANITDDRDALFSLGQFIWTGFDYIGEPTPYHTKNSYFGQIDTAHFKKDSYYIYQSAWTDYRVKPMVHVFPYWSFNEGQIIDVRVASNAPRIELQLNGRTIGTRDIDHTKDKDIVGWWKVPYEKGELKAIAYDENGNVIAEDVRRSFGDAKHIRLHADKSTLVADGTDLIFVEIAMDDEAGNPVENANNRVRVQVTGAGRLIGLDNGDSTDYDPYKGVSRRLFSGKLMAVVAATLEPGPIRIEVSSVGLDTQALEFEALPAPQGAVSGLTARTANRDMPIVMGALDEVPLRSIELVREGGHELSPSRPEVTIKAVLHPANTSYRDLTWSVVNDAGIPTNIAKIEANGDEVKVTAVGDGEFRLRCTSNNGTDKPKLISQLEFTNSGFGAVFKNPYEFVSAGLYDYTKGEIGAGNDRGIATSREGESQVGYRSLDFGPFGSDTITVPIFALNDEPYEIQIWEGMPDEEGSELIADVVYQKKMIWNVYQEETFRLSKRLSGVTSICFVIHKKVHIKGFIFEEQSRAFAQNHAGDCDHLYGDTFTRAGQAVEGIGNNVSLSFEQMNFGSEGTSKLVIYGRSPIDKNTIQIRFSGEGGEVTQIVEFTRSEGYEERKFTIDRITGLQSVTFVFLPGSNFDFGWFRFENE